MVDLPETPITGTTSRTPRTAITPGEVASPYELLSQSLDKMAGAGEAIATRYGEEAGQQAVTQGPNGQPVIAKAPLIGPASDAYARAANIEYMTRMSPQIAEKIEQARIDAKGDPHVLSESLKSYQKSLLDNTPPQLRPAIGRQMAEQATHAVVSTMATNDADVRAGALKGMQDELSKVTDTTRTLARQGLDTPEQQAAYESKAKDRDALLDMIAKDPRNHFTQESADIAKEAARNQDWVQQRIGEVVRKYVTRQNKAEAQHDLYEAFWTDPAAADKKLSSRERDAAVTEGLHALEMVGAEDAAEKSEFRGTVKAYYDNQSKGVPYDQQQNDAFMDEARRRGDFKSMADLDAIRLMHPIITQSRVATGRDAIIQLDDATKGLVPHPSMPSYWDAAAVGRAEGVSPTLMAVVKRASEISGEQFTIGDKGGVRSQEDQNRAVAEGHSKTYHSQHLTGDAIDLTPVGPDGKPDYSKASESKMVEIRRAMGQAAQELGVKFDPAISWDPAHHQLAQGFRGAMPAYAAAKGAHEYLQEKGWSKEASAGMVGNLMAESDMNPKLPGDSGHSLGIAQWKDDRRQGLFDYANKNSVDPYDLKTQLDYFDHELRTSDDPGVKRARAELEAAKTPEQAARAMMHFERPGGYTPDHPEAGNGYNNRLQYAQQAYAGDYQGTARASGRDVMIPGHRVSEYSQAVQRLFQSTIADMRTNVAGYATKQEADIQDTIKKGGKISDQQLNDFVSAAVEGGKEDLVPKVSEAIEANKASSNFTPAQIETMLNQARQGGDPAARRVLGMAAEASAASATQRKDDPIRAAQSLNNQTPGDLNPADPAGMRAELQNREKTLQTMRQQYPDVPPDASPILKEERAGFANLIKAGDPAQAQATITAMSQSLSPKAFAAAMETPETKAALQDAARSTSPQRVQLAMGVLDKLWKTEAGPEFKAKYGDATLMALLGWEATAGKMPIDQYTKILNDADNPAMAQERDRQRKAIDKEYEVSETGKEKISSAAVLSQFGGFAQRHLPSWVPGVGKVEPATDPNAFGESNALIPGMIRNEYVELVKGLRGMGASEDKAKEVALQQMQKIYSINSFTGKLMKNNPEQMPDLQIQNDPNWMQRSVNDWVSLSQGSPVTQIGQPAPEMTAHVPTPERGPLMQVGGPPTERLPQVNWRLHAIVPDDQTERDIRDGKPPSYNVVIDKNGLLEHVPGRWSANPEPYKPEAERQFNARNDYWHAVHENFRKLGTTYNSPDAPQILEEPPGPGVDVGGAIKRGLGALGAATLPPPTRYQEGDIVTGLGTRG
jgi:hypothetical protein